MSRAETVLASVVAAIAAVSLWLSLGLVALTRDTSATRIIALPPWWLLAAFLVVAIALTQFFQPGPSSLSPLLLTLLVWLPFVPGRIPVAFLIWQGPIEIAVWAIAVVLMLTRAVSLPAAFTNPSRAPWIAAVLTAIACAAGAAALREQLPIGDEPHYLMMTQSLIKDGDLRIENNHKNRDYQSFYKVDIPPHYLTRGKDGEIYSVHAPGVAVLVLPAFAVFGYYGAVATVSACVALAGAIGWHAAWLLTAQAAAAWTAWAAIFLTAPVFLQAITVFPDGVGTLPAMAGVWALIALDTRRRLSMPALLAVSLAVATLPWLHSRFAILAAGLALAIALRLVVSDWRRAMIFLTPLAVSVLLWLGFFWWIWGAATPAAPWGNGGLTAKAVWIPRGVFGLLFDPQAGVFMPAPAYLLAIAGWLVMLRSRPRLAVETLAILVALLLSVASYEAWWGGRGAPARYIVAGLPLALAAIAVSATMARTTATIVVTVSMLMLAAKVTAEGGATAFTPERGTNPVLAWMAPNVDLKAWRLQPAASELAFVKSWRPLLSISSSASAAINIPIDGSLAPPTASARLGDARVFFLDGLAYPEPTGFWVPAERPTSVVMDLDDQSRSLGLRLQAGPVATTADVEINGERRTFAFTPHQRHEIAVAPAAMGAWRITIHPRAGFRPVDIDPGVKDYRNLGIWVEVF